MLVTHAGRTGSTADVAKITNEVHLARDYRRPETSEGKTIRGESLSNIERHITMSRILIALYMGFLGSFGHDARGPNYDNQHSTEKRSRHLENYDPLPGFDGAQPVTGSPANKKYQKQAKHVKE
jgi:hypothetical protein